jgi:hypothetical protein
MPNIILKSGGKEVSNRRIKGGNVVAPWRQQQKSIAPKEGDEVVAQADASPIAPLQYEILYLPSDLITSKRLELHIVTLGRERSIIHCPQCRHWHAVVEGEHGN